MPPYPPQQRSNSTPARMYVDDFADRGVCIGQLEGKVAFVPFAAPGDTVEVEIVREKNRYFTTRLLHVIDPSPLRRTPPCPYFGQCGGCQWQHIRYDEQLKGKARSYQSFWESRLGHFEQKHFLEPLAAPRELGYRNRVGLKLRNQGGIPQLGFFTTGSHRLVPITTCPVAHRRINELLPALADFIQRFPPAHSSLPQVDLQVDGMEHLGAIFHLLNPLSSAENKQLTAFCKEVGLAGAWSQHGRKHTLKQLFGDTSHLVFPLQAQGAHLDLHLSPGGFVQANFDINQALVTEVLRQQQFYRDKTVMDLYCGMGNFTLPLALHAARVVGIEGYRPAARDAEENARRHPLNPIRILAESTAAGLRRLHNEGLRPDFVLLDPPREGAAEALDEIVQLGAEHLLYISCSPPTLVRDLKRFGARGYRPQWTRIADMFPNTAHVESLTLLSRV